MADDSPKRDWRQQGPKPAKQQPGVPGWKQAGAAPARGGPRGWQQQGAPAEGPPTSWRWRGCWFWLTAVTATRTPSCSRRGSWRSCSWNRPANEKAREEATSRAWQRKEKSGR